MKRIVVVGATSGIGRRVAQAFMQMGWMVGIAGRRERELQSLVDASDGMMQSEIIDVTAEDASGKLRGLIDKIGGMDVFFLSSGVGFQNPALESGKERLTVMTNVLGFSGMVDTAYNYFKESKRCGQIACISSIAGTKGLGVAASYSASKRYQSVYLDALEQLAEMQGLKISFTDIRPGFVHTDLLNDGHDYPMLLEPDTVARTIVKAVLKRKRVKIIDWKYAVLVFFWRLIPRWLWRKLPISTMS